MLSRKTLCLASEAPGFTLHDGDDVFINTVKDYYSRAENDAAEKLMRLKRKVAELPTEQFWRVLLPGIADILQAEYTIVAKRILPDDPNSVVEMPAIGEPGSCFNAVAMYIKTDKDEDLITDYSYATVGGACAQMRYDKVFLAPSRLAEYMPTRLAELKVHPESYIGIPLFYHDKCFGHIACIWSDESSFKNSGLSWGFTEMILHSLEDIISYRLLEGSTLKPSSPLVRGQNLIPQAAIAASQSLKPYARSLSHELRTPMQTMVGGMDLIGASLDDMMGCVTLDEALRQIQKAREMIEDFQDSSRRAVRAADNVVQAYDLNMQLPEDPLLLEDDIEEQPPAPLLVEQSTPTYANFTAKRKRDGDAWREKPQKSRILTHSRRSSAGSVRYPATQELHASIEVGLETPLGSTSPTVANQDSPTTPVVGLVRIRDLVRSEIDELVNHTDARPISAVLTPLESGGKWDVTFAGQAGAVIHKILEWQVQPTVPAELVIEEKELAKTFAAVIANAMKFTSDGGNISIDVRLSPRLRYVVFTVKDNGCGIPESFQPRLFQPFSREDDSITRHSEGLGLGLLVAKGNARKLGGDLFFINSATEGPNKGSHFDLKIPICPFASFGRHETPSRPSTPGRFDNPPTPTEYEPAPTSNPKQSDLKLALEPNGEVLVPPAQLLTPGSPLERPKPAVVKTSPTMNDKQSFDRQLGQKYPHRILVAEDSALNRKLVVTMLSKLGYKNIAEAFDGKEAVRLMQQAAMNNEEIDMILMDLWMPNMDGYEAAQRILSMQKEKQNGKAKRVDLKILAVTADITDTALGRAREVGMVGSLTKPFKVIDLEKLIVEHSQPAVVVA